MKKICAMLIVFSLCIPPIPIMKVPDKVISANAEDTTENKIISDGLIYELSGNRAYLIGVENPETVTSVQIPATVKGFDVDVQIGTANALLYGRIPNLEEINVDPESKYYTSIDGVLFSKTGESLIAYPAARQGAYMIPDKTRLIQHGAFSHCKGLTSVTLPENLREVGASAFLNCINLGTINGAVCGTLGNWFVGCSSLKSVVIAPMSYDEDMDEAEKNTLQHLDFTNCTALENVDIFSSCILTGFVNLNACTSLKEFSIPHHQAFLTVEAMDCSQLEKIILKDLSPASVTFGFSNDTITNVYGYDPDNSLQEYYTESGINFHVLTLDKGDIDGDSKVSVIDVLSLNRNLLGIDTLSKSQQEAADVNKDGVTDATDSLNILKYVVQLIDDFDSLAE